MSIPIICDFLIHLFKLKFSSSYINTARSAVSFFSLDCLKLGNNVYMQRIFKFFYRKRPIRSKYLTYWPVSSVLNLLRSWHPISSLSLKQLTLKTLALIALSSSDRGQTIHLMDITHIEVLDNHINFIILSRTKTTKRKLTPVIVKCICTHNEELNVASYVKYYLDATKEFRENSTPPKNQLFLSWKTHGPVTKQTIARWLTTVLSLSGIDTSKYTAHSYRGAGLSAAYRRGASLPSIMAAGNWTNISTFLSFYSAPSYDSSIGRLILEDNGKNNYCLPLHCRAGYAAERESTLSTSLPSEVDR